MFESQNPEKINIKDLSLDKPEKEGKTLEELREEFRGFLSDAFGEWYFDAQILAKVPEATNHTPKLIVPGDQRWQEKKDDIDPSKFGEYTLNPETIDIDWEAIPPEKIRVIKLSNKLNKPLSDVAEYVTTNYGEDYYIPGIEYLKYIWGHLELPPNVSLDGSRYFLFGSTLHDIGSWAVPYAERFAMTWHRGRRWLKKSWGHDCRVILLEKSAVDHKQRKDFSKPTPPMPEIRKF